jgi:uncharacterized UPF0146 family protein
MVNMRVRLSVDIHETRGVDIAATDVNSQCAAAGCRQRRSDEPTPDETHFAARAPNKSADK